MFIFHSSYNAKHEGRGVGQMPNQTAHITPTLSMRLLYAALFSLFLCASLPRFSARTGACRRVPMGHT